MRLRIVVRKDSLSRGEEDLVAFVMRLERVRLETRQRYVLG